MSGPTQDSGPAEEAPIFDSSAHPVPLRPSNERASSTDALTGSGISVPSGPQVTEVPPATRENRRAPHDVVEVVPDPRARDTFDAEIPDESPHGRNESDNSNPGAAGGQTEHAQAVAGVEAAMKTLPPVAKTSAQQYVFSTWEKFGWLSSIFLVGGLVVLLAAIGFLAFLWFGNWSNHTWNNIATQNWFTRAVSLSTLAVRNAVSLQAGVATSMLASVALEQMEVHILSAASISGMRNATSGPYFFT
jgi:hypothetical protein